MDSAKGIDSGFLLAVVERWRGATMGSQTRARPGGDAEFDELDVLAGSEFSRVRQDSPALAPAPSPTAAAPPLVRKGATTPESFFFPVEDTKPRLRR
jgi:hypothetical protein